MKKIVSILIVVGTAALSVVSGQNFFGDMPTDQQSVSDEQMLDNYLTSHIFFCFDVNHDGYLTQNETRRLMQSYLNSPTEKCPGAATYVDSKLITSKVLFTNLQNMFPQHQRDEVMKMDLLYRSSRDGCDTQKAYHNKVDGVQGTLTVVTSAAGQIFGGYTSVAQRKLNKYWDINDRKFPIKVKPDSDSNAFLFSLTRNETYPIRAGSEKLAIGYDYRDGSNYVAFGEDDLVLGINCRGSTQYFGEDFVLPTGVEYGDPSATYLTKEDGSKFEIVEMEVFQVTFYD